MPPLAAADTATTRFLEPVLAEQPSGWRWFPSLLCGAPRGEHRFGALAADPGWLFGDLTLPALEGRRTCFGYPVAPPEALVAWYIEHPDRLTWPREAEPGSVEALLRRALVLDDPPGSRARAQARAREIAPMRSAFTREWWRIEETHEPDCLLASDRLVIVIVAAGERLEPVTPWYPPRSTLVRGLETAQRLAEERAWGALLLSDAPIRVTPAELADAAAAPHLGAGERAAVADGYLGNLTWEQAGALVAEPDALRRSRRS